MPPSVDTNNAQSHSSAKEGVPLISQADVTPFVTATGQVCPGSYLRKDKLIRMTKHPAPWLDSV